MDVSFKVRVRESCRISSLKDQHSLTPPKNWGTLYKLMWQAYCVYISFLLPAVTLVIISSITACTTDSTVSSSVLSGRSSEAADADKEIKQQNCYRCNHHHTQTSKKSKSDQNHKKKTIIKIERISKYIFRALN